MVMLVNESSLSYNGINALLEQEAYLYTLAIFYNSFIILLGLFGESVRIIIYLQFCHDKAGLRAPIKMFRVNVSG